MTSIFPRFALGLQLQSGSHVALGVMYDFVELKVSQVLESCALIDYKSLVTHKSQPIYCVQSQTITPNRLPTKSDVLI